MQGEKLQNRVTIQDIAREVDMYNATVSAVLGNKSHCYASEKTKTMIREKAREMGYRPNLLARSLKNGRTHTIGLVSSAIQNEINANEVVCLTNGLLAYGYTTQVIYDRGETILRKKACETLIDHGCDAIVIYGHLFEEELPVIRRFPAPVYHIDMTAEHLLPGRTIYVNYKTGIMEAMECLNALGHENFYFIGGRWTGIQQDPRYRLFCNYCRKTGVSDPENRMLLTRSFKELNADQIENIIEHHPDVTAFIATNDIWALRVMQILHETGRKVPDDFSVVGFDNITASEVCIPSLSSIRQPVKEAAEEVIKMLMNELEGKNFPVQNEVPCRLVKRDSIGKARTHQLKFTIKGKKQK